MSRYLVTVNGESYSVELRARRGSLLTFIVAGKEHTVSVETAVRPTFARAGSSIVVPPLERPRATSVTAAAHEVCAPMPGIVSDIKVSVGDSVAAGAPLVVIEAMKMENPIKSPREGVVAQVHVTKGQEVGNGAVLVSFEK